MKKLLLIGAAFAVLLAPAMAAEKPVRVYKRPRAVVVATPVYSWTGFYVGGNVGYSWGDAHTDLNGIGAVTSAIGFDTAPSGFSFPLQLTDSNTLRLKGAIGGAQVGYNYQVNSLWVLGLETDFQISGERGSGGFMTPFSSANCLSITEAPSSCVGTGPVQGTAATTYTAKIEWFGTLRGRLGFLLGDQFLVYGTGGLAYGRVQVSGITAFSGIATQFGNGLSSPFAFNGSGFSDSKTNVGFSVGAGIEGRLAFLPSNWTWKLEYLYVDLGSLDAVSSFNAGIPGSFFLPAVASGTTTLHTHFTDNIVRVGLNYKFGYAAAPVYK